MTTKRKAAELAVINYTDPRTGAEYIGCGAAMGADGDCHRYMGHDGGHRLYLYKGDDPAMAAKRAASAEKRAAWKALTPEQQEAEYARRRQAAADRKAAAATAKDAPMPVMASSPATPARKPARRKAAIEPKRTATVRQPSGRVKVGAR